VSGLFVAGQIVADKMLQCFIIQHICGSSTNFVESNDKSEEKLSENTKISNKKEC
jgi:hypothetical protein